MVTLDERLSHHARRRMQQRSVPLRILDLLECYGSTKRAFYNADVYTFDRMARQRIRAELGDVGLKEIEPYKNAYMVVSDEGSVVTVARKYKRIKW